MTNKPIQIRTQPLTIPKNIMGSGHIGSWDKYKPPKFTLAYDKEELYLIIEGDSILIDKLNRPNLEDYKKYLNINETVEVESCEQYLQNLKMEKL